MTTEKIGIGSLSILEEGDYWNAYFEEFGNEKKKSDILLIGSISMYAITNNDERRKQFADLMKDIVLDIIKSCTDEPCSFSHEMTLPAHKKGGNA